VWPLKEYIDGEIIHTKIPKQRAPVEEYLKLQGRFAHLFEPQRNDDLIVEIQNKIDRYWENISAAK
jgi:pyruvate ferredoxin oxidoreductase beta subunit